MASLSIVDSMNAQTKLDCSACGLTSLDVSQNTALKENLPAT